MQRLALASLLVVALVSSLSVSPSAQDEPPANQGAAERAAERSRQLQERADERARRAEERAQRAQERFERRLERGDDHDGAHILFGRDYELANGSTTSETVVVFGGNATVNGHAEDDVVVVGGTLRLGPTAVVDGNVSVVGGELDRDPAARIGGDVDVTHISVPWSWGVVWPFPQFGRIWWEGAALAFTIGRLVLVLFVSLLLLSAAPRWITAIAGQLAFAPAVSTIAGFGAEILFAPALILLVVGLIVTIVGIPLLAGLPFLVAAFALVWVAGYTAVAGLIGARVRGTDWHVTGLRAADVLIGMCLLGLLTVFGQALILSPGWMTPIAFVVRGTGWMVEYIAWTVGLGAALTAWLRSDGFSAGRVPPSVPPLPTPSPSPTAM